MRRSSPVEGVRHRDAAVEDPQPRLPPDRGLRPRPSVVLVHTFVCLVAPVASAGRELPVASSSGAVIGGDTQLVKDASQLARGFPAVLYRDIEAVVAILPEPRHVHTARGQLVSVAGEDLELPSRIYNDPLPVDVIGDLGGVAELITGCVYSRHHDGYVRESACVTILSSAEPWVVPYVVQLLGEYVVEICALILTRLSAQSMFDSTAYRDFVAANPAYFELTRQRAISYWSCYYRRRFAREDYPALIALDRLRQGAAGPTG